MPKQGPYLGHLQTQTSVRWLGPDTGIGVGFIVDNNCSQQQCDALARLVAGRLRAPLFGINYVLRGEGTFAGWDGQVRPLRPGVVFYFDASRPYRLRHHDADFSECYICVHHSIYELLVRTRALQSECLWRDIGIHEALIAEFAQLSHDLDNPQVSNPQILRAAIALFERIHSTTAGERDEAIRHAQVLLGADLDRQLSMVAVARQLRMSYSYFHRIFSAATGLSPKEYRLRQRIDEACRLLKSLPAKQVAAGLGYDNLHFFSRQFKRYTGSSPRVFAQRLDSWRPRK
jgi:AraC-like DNA-binding protein